MPSNDVWSWLLSTAQGKKAIIVPPVIKYKSPTDNTYSITPVKSKVVATSKSNTSVTKKTSTNTTTGGVTQATKVAEGGEGGSTTTPGAKGPSIYAPGVGKTPGQGSNAPGGTTPGTKSNTPKIPSAVQTDEQFIATFKQLYGRYPFAEEIMGRKLIYPAVTKKSVSYTEEVGNEEEGDGGGGSGGGGGGSGGGGEVPETLGNLTWWENADSIQPLLRNWAKWLKETIESNKATSAISNPLVWDNENLTTEEEANKYPTGMPGYRSSRDVLRTLKDRLGVQFSSEDDATTKWQKLINAIPTADLDSQQLLASLQYDSNSNSWYSVDVGQLVNERYL